MPTTATCTPPSFLRLCFADYMASNINLELA